MNGSDYERRLARELDERGYHVMRAPSSGAATERNLPDLFWAKVGETAIAAELKATSQNVAYLTEDEAYALERFANAFAANPRIVARFKGDTTYYGWRIDDARYTDSHNFAVDRDIDPRFTINP